MKKIKITHAAKFAYPHIGGVETVINQINESLPDDKFQKEVLCCSNENKSSFENGVKYTRCRYLFEFAANTISPQLFLKMASVNTDIIHFHMPVIQNVIIWFILYHLKLIKYKKMIITYHGAIIGYDKYMKPFWGLYGYFYKKADKIHVLTPAAIENDKILKENKDKCVVIPFGIQSGKDAESCFSKEKYNEIKEKYKDKKILLCSGRITGWKGFNYAIEAVKYINNAVLLIMGDGMLKSSYIDYTKQNNLSSKVEFIGGITDEKIKNAYFKACDILIMPSIRTESFGIVQLEAMRYGRPVINTRLNTGVNYVSIDKETGLTVPPENAKALAEAVNTLLNNDELRLQYGRNARKRAEQLFNKEKIKNDYVKLYTLN